MNDRTIPLVNFMFLMPFSTIPWKYDYNIEQCLYIFWLMDNIDLWMSAKTKPGHYLRPACTFKITGNAEYNYWIFCILRHSDSFHSLVSQGLRVSSELFYWRQVHSKDWIWGQLIQAAAASLHFLTCLTLYSAHPFTTSNRAVWSLIKMWNVSHSWSWPASRCAAAKSFSASQQFTFSLIEKKASWH